jgi:MFS family permease
MAISALGLALLTRVHPDSSYIFDVLIPLAVMGSGMGVTFVSITAAAVTGVSHADTGLASALLNTGQQVGGSLGLAILTAVQTYRFNDLGFKSGINATPEVLTSAWAWAFAGAAILMAIGAAVAYGIISATKEEAAAALEDGAIAMG